MWSAWCKCARRLPHSCSLGRWHQAPEEQRRRRGEESCSSSRLNPLRRPHNKTGNQSVEIVSSRPRTPQLPRCWSRAAAPRVQNDRKTVPALRCRLHRAQPTLTPRFSLWCRFIRIANAARGEFFRSPLVSALQLLPQQARWHLSEGIAMLRRVDARRGLSIFKES